MRIALISEQTISAKGKEVGELVKRVKSPAEITFCVNLEGSSTEAEGDRIETEGDRLVAVPVLERLVGGLAAASRSMSVCFLRRLFGALAETVCILGSNLESFGILYR